MRGRGVDARRPDPHRLGTFPHHKAAKKLRRIRREPSSLRKAVLEPSPLSQELFVFFAQLPAMMSMGEGLSRWWRIIPNTRKEAGAGQDPGSPFLLFPSFPPPTLSTPSETETGDPHWGLRFPWNPLPSPVP